jgi:hypothetical protein
MYSSSSKAEADGLIEAHTAIARSLQMAEGETTAAEPNENDFGVESVRYDPWSGDGMTVERWVDWSYPTMSWNRHYCTTTAPYYDRRTLWRALISDEGSCWPSSAYWEHPINRDGQPLDYPWSGSLTDNRIGCQSYFLTAIETSIKTVCLNHWRPFC